MEIQQVLRNTGAGVAAQPVRRAKSQPGETSRSSADRWEQARQWVGRMEAQRARMEAALHSAPDKKSSSILDMLDEDSAEQGELDALSEQMKVQQKCLKIAMNIMKGKKVHPEDERYLMENDPSGYKLAMAMKLLVKEDKKECKSVLDEKDKNGGEETSESGEAAPAEGTSASGAGGGETVE